MKTPHTITDDNWPRHSDGRRKKLGEMTREQQEAAFRHAVARVQPEFSKIGVAVEFKGWKE